MLQLAISDENGTIPFYSFGDGSALNAGSREWAQCMSDGSNHMGLNLTKPKSFSVKTEKLSSIESSFRPCKYIKIDVEGLEDKVVLTLENPAPAISMEFNLPQFGGCNDAMHSAFIDIG